jgi:hypothetical protein
LTGDCRVTGFKSGYTQRNDGNNTVLFRSLANNRSLVDLDLSSLSITDDNWMILCDSLRLHPTLTSLDTRATTPIDALLSEQNEARMCAIADMMKHNTILQTIRLSERLLRYQQQIYTEGILPYLEMNPYSPRVHAVEEIDDRPVRQAVLGRALYCVTSNPNFIWMFLSQNVDAFVLSEED